MTRKELITSVENAKTETKSALQTVYDAMNHGQQKKMLRNPAIRAMFERYGVETEK